MFSNRLLRHVLAAAVLVSGCSTALAELASEPEFRIAVRLDDKARLQPTSGRLFVLIHTSNAQTPREVAGMLFAATAENPRFGRYAPLFGTDVDDWQPGATTVVDNDNVEGYPFHDFSEVPAGDYYVQAVFNVYTEVTRADGHTIKVPMDHWDGQQFHISPGNVYSEVKKVRIDPAKGFDVDLTLSGVIPPIEEPADTRFVKRIKFKSQKVSAFWNHDMYIGATVRLPNNYYDNPDREYPVLYYQGHFQEKDRFVIPERRPGPTGVAQMMYDAWAADDAPQIIAVTFQHATPYYDDSYAVNSANNGPYGDAIIEELIPVIEDRFRIIKQPWARVLTGGSTGGWVSAALQIYHPRFFGGTWSFCPDPVDFRRSPLVNLYEDDNAFYVPGQQWVKTEQLLSRSVEGDPFNTVRRASQLSLALGSHQRSAEAVDNWNALFGPVGPEGYPMPVWDHQTGEINKDLVLYWRDNGYDLRYYLEQNWETIGQDLEGKLHFGCGAMDEFYLNVSMYKMEDFLEKTENPYYGGWVRFAPRVGHSLSGYNGLTLVDLLQEMLVHIAANAPQGTDTSHWNVPTAP